MQHAKYVMQYQRNKAGEITFVMDMQNLYHYDVIPKALRVYDNCRVVQNILILGHAHCIIWLATCRNKHHYNIDEITFSVFNTD